jgi:transposase InsO family protein
MKNLFNRQDTSEIIERINRLTSQTPHLWGKMDVAQMLAHCGNGLEMAMGIINPRRVFIGRLIGGFLKSVYTNEKPFSKDSPTSEEIKVTTPKDFATEKNRLIQLVKQFSEGGESRCTKHPHPFFGKLTPAEWSIGMYKHIDHHFRQFGA